MKCISIRQPWAWLIIHAGKDIENRDWVCGYRGPLLIHASKSRNKSDIEQATYFAGLQGATIPSDALEFGGIIGKVEMVDCVTASDSPWFFGRYGFVLRDPVALPFFEMRGQLSLFEVDTADMLEAYSEAPR
jgi:hypothetical protein